MTLNNKTLAAALRAFGSRLEADRNAMWLPVAAATLAASSVFEQAGATEEQAAPQAELAPFWYEQRRHYAATVGEAEQYAQRLGWCTYVLRQVPNTAGGHNTAVVLLSQDMHPEVRKQTPFVFVGDEREQLDRRVADDVEARRDALHAAGVPPTVTATLITPSAEETADSAAKCARVELFEAEGLTAMQPTITGRRLQQLFHQLDVLLQAVRLAKDDAVNAYTQAQVTSVARQLGELCVKVDAIKSAIGVTIDVEARAFAQYREETDAISKRVAALEKAPGPELYAPAKPHIPEITLRDSENDPVRKVRHVLTSYFPDNNPNYLNRAAEAVIGALTPKDDDGE